MLWAHMKAARMFSHPFREVALVLLPHIEAGHVLSARMKAALGFRKIQKRHLRKPSNVAVNLVCIAAICEWAKT